MAMHIKEFFRILKIWFDCVIVRRRATQTKNWRKIIGLEHMFWAETKEWETERCSRQQRVNEHFAICEPKLQFMCRPISFSFFSLRLLLIFGFLFIYIYWSPKIAHIHGYQICYTIAMYNIVMTTQHTIMATHIITYVWWYVRACMRARIHCVIWKWV